jgi:general secretion pathway protein G
MERTMHRRLHGASRSGFTLLEILLVLAILGVLATVAAVNLIGTGNRARIDATGQQLITLKQQLTAYNLDKGGFPTTQEGLRVLVPNYMEKIPLDAWNTELAYLAPMDDPNRPFELKSAGPDRQFGTEDDISVWEL